jgi:hypothetical protein
VQWEDVGRRRLVRCTLSVRSTCSDGGWSVQGQDVGRGRRCAVRCRYAVLAVTVGGQCRARTYCRGALLASETSSRPFRDAVTKMLSVFHVESTDVTHGSYERRPLVCSCRCRHESDIRCRNSSKCLAWRIPLRTRRHEDDSVTRNDRHEDVVGWACITYRARFDS